MDFNRLIKSQIGLSVVRKSNACHCEELKPVRLFDGWYTARHCEEAVDNGEFGIYNDKAYLMAKPLPSFYGHPNSLLTLCVGVKEGIMMKPTTNRLLGPSKVD